MNASNLYQSRRNFLKLGSCAFIASSLKGQQIPGANDRLRVGVLGCGIRGNELLRYFHELPDVDVVAICDPDTARMESALARLAKKHGPDSTSIIDQIQDYRKLYERKDIDAVAIASPNYWHALQAIEALQAGKHVYLEKPVSFTPWECFQLEAAERKYGKIIAAGYQNRSSTGPVAGIRYVHEGKLGKIKKVRSVCYNNRGSIGKLDHPLQIPKTVDYNLWLGPVEQHIPTRPELHYDWHWDYRTGNGDVGNLCVHELDMVCWLLGEPQLPTSIQTFGNRFAWNDAADTPNMLSSQFEMGGVDVILEMNTMTLSPDRNTAGHRMGTRLGIIVECEKGYLKGGRFGMVALEPDGKTVIKKFPGEGGKTHQRNFVDAIKDADASLLRSKITTATTSALLAHFTNISHRLGELASSQEIMNHFGTNDDLAEIIKGQGKQLAVWGISEPEYYAGQTISIDPETRTIASPDVGARLTGPKYRKGFELSSIA